MNRSLCALTALLLACAVLAVPAPEPFVTGWGRPVDPDKDCKFGRDKGVLTIEMPGTDHDYEPRRKRFNAPRILHEFEGDFDIQMRVRIDCRPSPQSTVKGQPSYVSAGFLLFFPKSFAVDCIRLDYRLAGQGDRMDGGAGYFLWFVERGGGGDIWDKRHPEWPFNGKPDYVYLRLDRRGDILGCYISPDREKWFTFGGGQHVGLPSKLTIGLAASSTSADLSKVQFDQLTITKGMKRESWDFVSDWGNPVDPDKDCKIQRQKYALTIEMPGSDHDYNLNRKRFNAPRLLCELEGDFDVEVRVRIEYRPSAPSSVKGQPPFVSAGFLLLHPDGHSICDRLEYSLSQQKGRWDDNDFAPRQAAWRRMGQERFGREEGGCAVMKTWICEEPLERSRRRQANRLEWDREKQRQHANEIWGRGWQNWPLPANADCAYLRLEQRVDWSCFYISADGQKWTRLASLPGLHAGGKVALAAYSTSTEPSKVIFDRLKLARGKKAER